MSWSNALPMKFVFPLTLDELPKPDGYYQAPFKGQVNGNGNIAVLGSNNTFVGFIKCSTDEERNATIEAIDKMFQTEEQK